MIVKSRIDRILFSPDWLVKWPDCKQYSLGRSVLDYCVLILKVVLTGVQNRLGVLKFDRKMVGLEILLDVSGTTMKFWVMGCLL